MDDLGNLTEDQLKLYNVFLLANNKQTIEITSKIELTTAGLTNKIENTHKQVEILSKRCVYLERKNRKNNVVIFGIINQPDQLTDLLQSTIQSINYLLGTNITEDHINNIYTIGKSRNPPIVLEFISFLKKITLFSNKENFKKLKEHGISIANDLSLEDREGQQTLRRHLQIARSQNREAKILGYKLLIDNISYTPQELKEIEESEKTISEVSEEEREEEDKQARDIDTQQQKIQQSQQATNKASGSKNNSQPVVKKDLTKQDIKKKKKRISYSPIITRAGKR